MSYKVIVALLISEKFSAGAFLNGFDTFREWMVWCKLSKGHEAGGDWQEESGKVQIIALGRGSGRP